MSQLGRILISRKTYVTKKLPTEMLSAISLLNVFSALSSVRVYYVM